MRKKNIGEEFEELTVDEMKLVQGSGDVEVDFNISTFRLANATMAVTALPVLITPNRGW